MIPADTGAEAAELDAAEDKAEFCLATGVPPSEYDLLSDVERDAFVRLVNRRNKS